MDRPFKSSSIVDLTRIVDDQSSTVDVNVIMTELRLRKSNAARELLARLERKGRHGMKRESKVLDREVSSDESSSYVTSSSHARPLEAEERLAILRETYSEGAEILARWGLTTAVPRELFDVAVEWWRLNLLDVPDEFGRTQVRLEDDAFKIRSRELLGGVDVGR